MPTRPYSRAKRRTTPARRRRQTGAAKSMAKRVVDDWVAEHGHVCPGWRRPPHRSADLTADHIIPVVRGGTNDPSNYRVLCRSCNSSRGAD